MIVIIFICVLIIAYSKSVVLNAITMPLVFLPAFTWQSFLVPTLEGQYIIKNVLIMACGVVILSHLKPYLFTPAKATLEEGN